MADTDSDGIADALDGHVRVALTVAQQMGEKFARLREELARTAQASTERQTRELQARFDAERSAAAASLTPVQQSQWWNHASVDDIGTAYETAHAWAPADAGIARVEAQMGEELRTRYNVDVNRLDADPEAVREAMIRVERDRADAAVQRRASSEDITEAATLLAAADALDLANERRDEQLFEANERTSGDSPDMGADRALRDADEHASGQLREDGEIAYDSAERRDAFESDLERASVEPTLIKSRMAADRDQGTPATAAVAHKPGQQAKARGRNKSPALERERGGLSR
jgi:hypothetical protein